MFRKTFGFEKIRKFFEKAIKDGQVFHAYIFSGQEAIGKKTFALELASFLAGSSQDIYLINPDNSESGRSVTIGEVRKIRNISSLSSFDGLCKVIVIDDAHLMTVEAQNALLKRLEEPGDSTIFMLVTSSADSLLPTIRSRCQEIKFSPHPQKIIEQFLSEINLTSAQKEFLVEFSNGRSGLIKQIIEEHSFNDIKKTVEELAALIKADLSDRLTLAQKLSEDKKSSDLEKKILYWILYVHMRLNELFRQAQDKHVLQDKGILKTKRILANLLDLNKIIVQPQFNLRLALENFVITL